MGTDEDADWQAIGQQTDESARRRMAKITGLSEDASWDEIGAHVEKDTRSGIARFVGATPDADWAAIGQAVEQRVRTFLNDIFSRKEAATPTTPPEKEEQEGIVDPWQ